MRFDYILVLCLLIVLGESKNCFSNSRSRIDSLETQLKKSTNEESVSILGELTYVYFTIDLRKSLNFAGKSLEISEKLNNAELIAKSNIYIADVYFEMSRFRPAIEFYEKALDYFYEQRETDTKIYIYNKLGHTERMLGNYNNALFYYQKPLNLYLAENNLKISEAYNNIGIIYKFQGQYNHAANFHQKALNAANTSLDQNEIANTLKSFGSLYWYKSKYDSSLYYYEKALDMYRELTDTIGEANILSNIGIIYKDIGEFKKALDYNIKALELRTENGSRKEISNSYNVIGSIYLANKDLENALEFYFTSLKIREAINDVLGAAQTQKNIALVYKQLEKHEEALDYLSMSLNNYSKIGNKSLIASTINQLGSLYKKLNRYDLALENYLKALKLQQELNNQDKIASILNNIGIIYDNINNYSKALESYSKALEIKRKIGNNKEIAYSLHIIGNTYLKLKNFSKALEYYNESLSLRLEVGDKVSTANSYKSIGNTYLELGDYLKAYNNLNEAFKLRDEIGDIKGVSEVLKDLGNYYLKQNNLNSALDYFTRTVGICQKTNDQYLMALCLRKIGVIQIEKGFIDDGVQNIEQSLKIGQNIDNLELIKLAYLELFNYYNSIGNKDKALDSYINYTVIKDTLNAKMNSQKLVEIQMNFELEKSYSEIDRIENEVNQLTAESKIRELELKKQKNVRNLLIIIFLITLTSSSLIFVQFLSKRKTNILLQEKIAEADHSNRLLKESKDNLKVLNATKDKFFSIIAHDLRNPFNALHGLTHHLISNYEEFDSAEIKQSIEIIYKSADDLLELLENLLHWSRSQRGKMEFRPQEINLSDLINKTFNLLSMNAKKKSINLVNEIRSDTRIVADYDMLTTIMRNLISNAIKFSYSDSFIRISSETFKEHIEISVMDNGVGISEENINKLFKVDMHHSTEGTSKEQGSGLGLILCQEFVEKHNGKIWAESEPKKGSTFKFTISKNILI